MAIWITFYNWAAFASSALINWTMVGTVGYVLIFCGSTPLTEWISANKYPQYKEYQKLVGMFVPGLLGGLFKGKQE
jgi:steroid 5-alpha reductase family enzyme